MSLKPKALRENFPKLNGLEIIHAPWRHKYFALPHDPGCFICRAVAANPRNDAKNLLLVRGQRALIMLNRFPYTTGAMMVAPYAHLGDFRAPDDETLMEMNRLVQWSMNVLDAAFKPKAYNIGVNQGKAAGAGLQDHLHIHVVPRWDADTNFMTTIGGARVLAEDVDSMYKRLRQTRRKLERQQAGIR